MKQEVELKLELACELAEPFSRLSLLPEQSEVAKLEAVYFDTPDKQLSGKGVSLRIRKSGKRRVQTVKADRDGATGLFARAEWEMPVPGNVPVLDTRTPVAAMLGDAVQAIEPMFHVDVERRTWLVAENGAEIELVLDQGRVHAGDREEPVCEVELELKSGEPGALFALARRIDAEVPVRPAVLSKSERGYRLLEALPTAVKAEAVALNGSMTAQRAFVQVVLACVRHYRLNEALLMDHYDPKALHQARVAIRRLRSALFLFKPMLALEDLARFQGELKWLAGELGEARNLDVLAERAENDDLRERLEVVRAEVHTRIGHWLRSARVRMLMMDLVEWLSLGAGQGDAVKREMPAARFAGKRMQKLYRRIAKGGEDMEDLSDDERHEVRKNAKKLRYAAEFFVGLYEDKKQRRRQGKFVAALEKMQAELGTLSDFATGAETLRHYGLDDQGELTPDAKAKRKVIAAAADAHEALVDAKRFWT
ncbi:CYTH and CHAD domain-containing protein [Sphingobium bisphenolivorans]|uniref:CYTH and CHAD domain-containing protein n=1 Tax=Sphingobium bisphenolivorans TaxID=1335760 RepID=UPI00039A323A|nr:CYTH and CHAD domain-containing protein [Sphingobium bisphenolivorans]